jgi:hypothetical protein
MVRYWNPYDTGTSPTYNYSPNDTTATSTPTFVPSWGYTTRTVTRRILVEMPDGWGEEKSLAFTRLVNIETKTGWRVTLIIKGNIIITDPNVERRTLADFIPLLASVASYEDIKIIIDFFEKNPI